MISVRGTTREADQSVAPPTSMYSMKRISAPTRPAYSTSAGSSSSFSPRMTTVSSFTVLNARAAAAMPASTASRSRDRDRRKNRPASRVSRLTVTRSRPAARRASACPAR